MAVTRIKNNQITDSTITAAKIASGTLTGGLFAADITLASNVTITGNLSVTGASDSISATNTYVNDPLVVFNNGFVAAPSYDIGILVNRNLTATAPYGSVNAAWVWREQDKAFEGLMTTETGTTTGSINNSGFANLKIGNLTANSLTLTSGTLTASSGITGTPISGSTGYFTVLQGTAFSTANAVITGGSVNGTVIGNATPAAGWFTTLYGQNFSTGNAVISGGYISALTNATITTATTTTLNAATATAAVLNATSGNVTTGYFGSLNTANAVITGGYVNGLANLTATTAQATNFSSGNIYATGSTTGTWSTANVSLYQQLTNTTVNANLAIPLHDKYTGNAASLTNTGIAYNPSTNTLFIGTLVTNGGNIGGAGGTTSFTSFYATNFSTGNAVITGGYINGLSNLTATTTQTNNFSSGNIYATGTTSGTWSTANVSLYQQLAAGTQSANVYVPFYDKATGNAAAYTNNNILFTPSTGTLYVPNIITNSGGGASFPTLYVGNFSSPNVVISGGYISALTNATITTATTTTLNAGTATAATLNATAGNVTTGYFGSLNTANAVITGGYINNLSNLTATTSQATNFSSGNIYATGSTTGTWSTANVALYDSLAATTTNATFYPQVSDKTSGNAAAYTVSTFTINPSTGALSATSLTGNHYGTTAQFTNFSTGNAVISGGYISSLSNITATTASFGTSTSAVLNASAGNITTLAAGSINTANAVITGGYVNGLSNLTATTTQTTNFSSGNVAITGGYASGLANVIATTGSFGTATAATLNATAGNITTLYAGSVNTANAVISGGYISSLSNITATTANFTNGAITTLAATNFSSGNAVITGGYVNNLANLTATTAQATNFSTGNARITGGYADNFPIGANVKATGAFTTLTATGQTTLTNTTQATNYQTGALVVSGGVGIAKDVYIQGNLYVANLISSTTSELIVSDPLLYLTANSIYPYNYDIGIFSQFVGGSANVYQHSGMARSSTNTYWGFFSNVISEPSATINWADGSLIWDPVKAGELTLANTTPSTSTATGALKVSGGAGIVGNLNAGNVTTSMATGTVMGNVGNFNNLYGTFYGTIAGQSGSANVSLYQAITDATVNSSHYIAMYDKATGNAAAYTDGGITYNPSTGALTATSLNGNHYGTTAQFTNFSTANAVISGGYISSLTNATITTGTVTNLAGTTTVATNFSSGNVAITGGYINSLANLTATTAQATNFSSGNIYATSSTSGTWSTANVSLYQQLTNTNVNANLSVPLHDKATGNAASLTSGNITYNPFTNTLFIGMIVTNGGNIGSTGGFGNATAFSSLYATNFSSPNVLITGGYISSLSNITATTANFGTSTSTILNATSGNITTLYAGSINTANAVITGGYINNLSNLTATTTQTTNLSTGNAVITGGSLNNTVIGNTTPASGWFTTLYGQNFSTGNAVISGGYISSMSNITSTNANHASTTSTILNATSGNITTGYFGSLNTANAVITGGYINGLSNLTATTTQTTNLSTGNAVISGGYISALTNATITTATTTTLNAGTATAATLNSTAGNVTTLYAGSINTANAVITGGYINNLANLTATTAFATNFSSGNIVATGTTSGTWSTANVSLYDSITASTTNATFYPQVVDKATGNVAAYSVSSFTINPSTGVLSATTFSGSGASLTNLPATAVVGTVTTANVALYDSITASTTNATFYPQLVDKATGNASAYSAAYITANPSTNTLSANVFSGAVTATTVTASSTIIGSGNIVAASSTDSTSTTTGALVVVGGVGIAGNVYHGKAAVFNSSKTAAMDFVVKGKTDETLIWARPGASYDQVVIGNSATTSTLVTGAKLIVNTTDSILIPVGTTAQRPSSAGGTDTAGMIRYNSTSNNLEFYNGSSWQTAGSAFTVVTDTQFNGDGGTVAFTSANFASATTNGLIVSINGVVQIPSLAYSLTGSTITFTEAPASGDVIDVRVLTTTTSITSIASVNGYMGVSADNSGVYISTGTASATVFNWFDTTGGFVSNIGNVSVASANTPTTVDTISNSAYRSAKYVIQVTNGASYQVSEALVIQNGTTATVAEYGVVRTGSNLGVISATVSGGNTLVQFIAANATNNVRIRKEYMVI